MARKKSVFDIDHQVGRLMTNIRGGVFGHPSAKQI